MKTFDCNRQCKYCVAEFCTERECPEYHTWADTKTSNNDIALMIQYAIRHIYKMLNGAEMKQNFILRDTEDGLKITKYLFSWTI